MGAVALVIAAISVYFPWSAHRDKRRAVEFDGSRRLRRSGHKSPLTQPVSARDALVSESLVGSMRCNRRSPLEFYAPRSRPKSLWAWFRRSYMASDTSPKPQFSIDGWEYRPGGPSASDDDGFRHSSGFSLGFILEGGENAHHLKRSILAGKLPLKRLVVLASDEDMGDSDSLVRCLIVNARTALLAHSDPKGVVVQSTDRGRNGGPQVYLEKQGHVPADALWLVYPKQEGSKPATNWGARYERYSSKGIPSGRCAIEDLEHARRAKRDHRRLLAFKSLGAAAFGVGYALYAARASMDELNETIWSSFARGWLLLWIAIASAASVCATGSRVRKAHWFKGDSASRRQWGGGTLTAAWLGVQIKGGRQIDREAWRHYAETTARSLGADRTHRDPGAALAPDPQQDSEIPPPPDLENAPAPHEVGQKAPSARSAHGIIPVSEGSKQETGGAA